MTGCLSLKSQSGRELGAPLRSAKRPLEGRGPTLHGGGGIKRDTSKKRGPKGNSERDKVQALGTR